MERRNAGRMKREDERILEYLGNHGLSSPSLVAREQFSRVSPAHVRERLRLLAYAGLVDSVAGSYELTAEGREYLNGELDARHRPTPPVDRLLG